MCIQRNPLHLTHLPTHSQTTQLVVARCLEVSREIFKLIYTTMGKLTYIQWIYINQQLVKKREFRIYFVFFHGIPCEIWNGNNGIPVISATFSAAETEIFLSTEFRGNTETEILVQH